MYITTFDQLGIAKFCPKQEIIDVITKFKETNELWIKCRITQHGMNIARWKGVVDYFKIEIIHFMIDTSHKFAVNSTDIKIQEGVLFVTACTTFEQQCAAIYLFCNVTKIFEIYCTNIIEIPAIIW